MTLYDDFDLKNLNNPRLRPQLKDILLDKFVNYDTLFKKIIYSLVYYTLYILCAIYTVWRMKTYQ